MTSSLRLFLLSLFCVSLSACSSSVQNDELGAFSGTGSIANAEISLTRRGTHLFQSDDGQEYFLESKTVNISEFTGKKVWIEGVREKNTKGMKPVIVLSLLRPIHEAGHEWNISQWNISLTTPETWQKVEEGKGVSFTQSGQTILSIHLLSGSSLKEGKDMFIGGKKALLHSTEQEVKIEIPQKISVLLFTLSKEILCAKEDCTIKSPEEWLERMLQENAQFQEETSTQTSSASPEEKKPCGGEAGILCPVGSFCDIQDTAHQIGICREKK